jgi:light-regulated signal transduction histidine kinase (bacteriophytochrome)
MVEDVDKEDTCPVPDSGLDWDAQARRPSNTMAENTILMGIGDSMTADLYNDKQLYGLCAGHFHAASRRINFGSWPSQSA